MLAACQSNKRRITVVQLTLDFGSLGRGREGSRKPHPAGVLDAGEQEDSGQLPNTKNL